VTWGYLNTEPAVVNRKCPKAAQRSCYTFDMDLQTNPFAVLSLIAAPAVLTNACSVLALGTGNRLARTVDRARFLTRELETQEGSGSPSARASSRELAAVQQRMLMLIRALRAFYTAIGSFASAALISLAGAVLSPSAPATAISAIEIVAVCVGALAVGALVRGAFLLVRETRVAVGMLAERAKEAQLQFAILQEGSAKDTHGQSAVK
jgi:hypothetical protein